MENPRRWALVAAHEQSAGRGRLTRSWKVPAGAAVTMSMTVPLPPDTSAWGWVPLFVGEAVREALAELSDASDAFGLKWPNDVLARDADGQWRKAGGILCQMTRSAEGEALVVAGIGLNITQNRADLPVETATSMSCAGHDLTRDAVLEAVAERTMDAARRWSDGSAGTQRSMRDTVRAHCLTIGADVDIHTPDGAVTRRRAVGIDDSGRIDTVPLGHGETSPHRMAYSVADVVHARLRGGDDLRTEMR